MNTTYYLTTSTNFNYAIKFDEVPPPTQIGNKQQFPFVVTISAEDTGTHDIELYSQFSNSQQYQLPQNKWSHLVPQWRFTDVDGNHIERVTTTDTQIYSGTEVIGITGFAEFYYIDDMPSTVGNPVILWATLPVSGLPLYSESENGTFEYQSFANSKVVACQPYFINGMVPKELNITRNGITPLSSSIYWVNQNISNIITINGKDYPEFGCSNAESLNILYNYPSSNELGIESGLVSSSIVTIPTTAQTWNTLDRTEPYFLAYDNNNFRIGGYIKNSVKSSLSSLEAYITAGVNYSMDIYKDTPYIWIPNPDNNILHRVINPYISQTTIDNITSWLENGNLGFVGQNLFISTPYLTQQSDMMSLTGFGGIYGIAVDPCYNVWATDSEMDRIYKFRNDGTLLSTINLTSYDYIGCTPAGITIDSKNKIWVSLFDSASVLKFDGTTGELLLTINPEGNQDEYIDGLGYDIDYKPTKVETDVNDNVWVSFTNSMFSILNKYDTNGSPLVSVTLPTCANPMDILVDNNDDLWVTLTKHSGPPFLNGGVQKYDTNGTLQFNITSLVHPEYITIDKESNIWVTNDYNTVTKIDTNGNIISNITIGNSNNQTYYTGLLQPNALEGIATDSANRIWVLNAIDSKAYILSAGILSDVVEFPNVSSTWIIDTNNQIITTPEISGKSIQAFGDWTGYKWFAKYSNFNGYVSGSSSVFNIDDFNGYDIRKFNESFDMTQQMKNYAIPEFFNRNNVLFDDYLGTMVGGLETSAHSIGRQAYEKIANYVENVADVETCNIYNLYSIAEQMDVPIDDYLFAYPSELKRIMDIVSINHKKLWGDRCRCSHNFKINSYGYCTNCGHKHESNRGNPLDTDTYIVSSGIPYLAEYRFYRDKYELITPVTLYQSELTSSLQEFTSSFYVQELTASNISVLSSINVLSSYDMYVTLSALSSIDVTYVTAGSSFNDSIVELYDYFPSTFVTNYGQDCNNPITIFDELVLTNPYPVKSDLICYDSFAPDDHLFLDGVNQNPCPDVVHLFVSGTILKADVPVNGTAALNVYDSQTFFIGVQSPARVQWVGVEDITETVTETSAVWYTELSTIDITVLSTFNVEILSSYYINVLSSFTYYDIVSTTIQIPISTFTIYQNASTYLLYTPEEYCFYEYIPTQCGVQNEGIINWSDEYTTLDENISSINSWYNEGGTIEKMINYTLKHGMNI